MRGGKRKGKKERRITESGALIHSWDGSEGGYKEGMEGIIPM